MLVMQTKLSQKPVDFHDLKGGNGVQIRSKLIFNSQNSQLVYSTGSIGY